MTNRIGEKSVANNGQGMVIIGYKNSKDIDIRFDDGTVLHKRSYRNFKDGAIKNPNGSRAKISPHKKLKEARIGESRLSGDNQKMTIIAYRNANDIDIMFGDGAVIYNRRYSEFKAGAVRNPMF